MKRAEWWGGQGKWTLTGANQVPFRDIGDGFASAFVLADLRTIATKIAAREHIAQGSVEGLDPGRNQFTGAEHHVVLFASRPRVSP